MNRTVLPLAFVALVACNDKEPISPPAVPMKLITGADVTGLRWTSGSNAGVTNQGFVGCTKGEPVTFTVGGTTLGTTTCAAQMSPLDFFPNAVATSPLQVINGLQSDGVSDVQKVANIVLFIAALDNDATLDNGIDLTAADAKLATANLSFAMYRSEFAVSLYPLFARYSVPYRGVTGDEALSRFYAELGFSLAGMGSSVASDDYDNDGQLDSIQTSTYDGSGHITQLIFANGAGVTNITRKWTYDNLGRPVSVIEDDVENDASIQTSTTTRTFDASTGLRTAGAQHFTQAPDGDLGGNTTMYSYDASGRPLGFVLHFDNQGGNTNTVTMTATYDDAARTVTFTSVTHPIMPAGSDSVIREVYGFDVSGNQIEDARSTDSTADGSFEYTDATTRTFSAAGCTGERRTVTSNGAVTFDQTTTYTLDDRGRRVTMRDVAGGTDKVTSVSAYTYNDASQATRIVTMFDTTSDGTNDETSTQDRAFDSATSNVTSDQTVTVDGTGTTTGTSSIVYGYDADGYRTSILSTRFNGTKYTGTTTYVPVSNVLRASQLLGDEDD